jgi:N-acetylglucosaminyldiphosphoundecaprenol N-acetyl-beta-D-mannosaminyltransferase
VAQFSSYSTLGVRVHAVQIPDVVHQFEEWIEHNEGCHCVAVTGMHGVMEALHHPEFRDILNAADLVVPDGMPLVWVGRLRGHALRRRVYGPDLMVDFCATPAAQRSRHFFFGGKPGVAERLAETLSKRFPGMKTAGVCSPPFRPPTSEEDDEIIRKIEQAAPDVLWVGLSTPKQERWMHAHRDRLRVPVMVGVGAAFDIHSGELRQAPYWMREHGFEWLFRLLQEPQRLWHRYLVYGTQFAFYALLELSGLRRFE